MRKPIAAFTVLLLCLAVLAGCRTNVGMPNPDAPTFNENAPPTTDAEATAVTTTPTTIELASTESTAVTTHFKDSGPPLKLLEYKMDENGIFYRNDQDWLEHIRSNPDSDRWEQQFGTSAPNPSYRTSYATVRVKFRYSAKDWTIEMFKGRAGPVMLGCEICVFPEEALVFQMDVYQRNFSAGKTTYLFTRGPESAAWYNGFVPGSFYEYDHKAEIIVVGSITFPDEEMLRAFEAPFAKAGFNKGSPSKSNPETYSINGTTLTFSWQYIDQDA